MTCTNQSDSQMLHFADVTNLLYINKSMKKINKDINHNLSLIVQLLTSNKIAKHLNFRISGQKIEIIHRVLK